jgi:hypothetical protein
MPAALKICPCCNRPLPPAIELQGKIRRRYWDFISRHPEGVTKNQIFDAVYGDDPNGGPLRGDLVVRVNVYHINKVLRKHGLRVTGRPGGPGAVYRLVKL